MLSKLFRYLPIIIALFRFLSKMFARRNAGRSAESHLPPMPESKNGLEDLWGKLGGGNGDSPAETSQGLDPIHPNEDVHSPTFDGVERLYQNRTSDAMVVDKGTVVHVLPDDTEGVHHQKFIVQITPELTILIAHNIDMAERASVKKGDSVRFKGEYEWDERGGVIHWTHHDPKGWHEAGWIEINGRRVS